jgi:hypothetical protein
MAASFNSRLAVQKDSSIFVEGDRAKGTYRVSAAIPLDKVTGIRLEALTDDRLPNRGPGYGNGNFVVTEFAARSISSVPPQKLVRTWDFSGGEDDWQVEEGAKVVADSGMRHVFGVAKPAGIKTALKLPVGAYLVDVVTGIHSAASISVQWTTDKAPAFDEGRLVRRNLPAGNGGGLSTLVPIQADGELTSLRIVVDGDQTVLPIDAVRLFATDAGYADIKLQNAKADFSQGGYPVESAIDGNSSAESGNGWAVAPQVGQNHTATFELASPLEGAKSQRLELVIHQNFVDGQHSLGKFRVSVTDSPAPLNLGLPAAISEILAKSADKRTDAERDTLLARLRDEDKGHQELAAKLAEVQKPVPADPQLKKLEDDLAAAQQPLPIDQKLQRLRRAVALSEDQMKNKRLTVAQDIVWALINNPAFLYNH